MEIFQSIRCISTFFADVQLFDWMLESSLTFYKSVAPDDPSSFESVLVECALKSVTFAELVIIFQLYSLATNDLTRGIYFLKTLETWESVKKLCESSLSSPHLSVRCSTLNGLLYLLRKLPSNTDTGFSAPLVNITMEYIAKYLGYIF